MVLESETSSETDTGSEIETGSEIDTDTVFIETVAFTAVARCER